MAMAEAVTDLSAIPKNRTDGSRSVLQKTGFVRIVGETLFQDDLLHQGVALARGTSHSFALARAPHGNGPSRFGTSPDYSIRRRASAAIRATSTSGEVRICFFKCRLRWTERATWLADARHSNRLV